MCNHNASARIALNKSLDLLKFEQRRWRSLAHMAGRRSFCFRGRLSLLLAGSLLAVPVGTNVLAGEATSGEEKADALLSRMSLEEKIGQMTQVDMNALKDKADIQKYYLGSMLSGGDSDPADITAQGWLKACEEYQSWALKTRLKIPLLYGIDAVHGHNNVNGAVIFPHNIGLGATRNPALVEEAAHITALEVAGTGMHWAFAPCVAVAQNISWGRTYESFGEDPKLASELGAAAVRGFQRPLPQGNCGPGLRQAFPGGRRNARRR